MDLDGFPWSWMDFLKKCFEKPSEGGGGQPWESMDPLRKSIEILGFGWISMDLDGVPWIWMEFLKKCFEKPSEGASHEKRPLKNQVREAVA